MSLDHSVAEDHARELERRTEYARGWAHAIRELMALSMQAEAAGSTIVSRALSDAADKLRAKAEDLS